MRPSTRYIQAPRQHVWRTIMAARDAKESKPRDEATPRVRGEG